MATDSHYCHCGRWGSFGFKRLPPSPEGEDWYCREHKPGPDAYPPKDPYLPLPAVASSTTERLL